ncbi:MAG: hypothetical protein ACM3QS_12235 [Bacteroidota bacterium]
MKARTPFRVTVFLWMVLILTAWNALRLWTAVSWRAPLAEFAPVPGPLYIGVSAAVWVTLGIFNVWSLWKGKPWTRRLILASGAAYTAWYWLDRLLLQKEHPAWAFTLLLNLLLLLHVLYTARSSYFQREAYEQQLEDQHSQ